MSAYPFTIWFCEDCTNAGVLDIAEGTGAEESVELVRVAHGFANRECAARHAGARLRVAEVDFVCPDPEARDEGQPAETMGGVSGAPRAGPDSSGRRAGHVRLSAPAGGPRAEAARGGRAIVTVTAGAGGIDAQDWAEMVLRMEMCWARRSGVEPELLDHEAGDEAGIKTARFAIPRSHAVAIFGGESGVHRLVRRSPHDPEHRRQSSFAMVEVEGDGYVVHPVRSYVLHPYELVTDHLTEGKSRDVLAILDGDLSAFREGGATA